MGRNTYKLEDKMYDISKLKPEGQKAFSLLADAEREVLGLSDKLTIAKAATIALHQKLQEFLTDEAITTENEEN